MNDELVYSRREWLEAYKFRDPFEPEFLRAERDILLEDGRAFVEFPYFGVIEGKPDMPGPRFIFAGRGGGKTALRLRLQRNFDYNLETGGDRILAVTYNQFDRVLERADHDPRKVVPRYHVEEIITLIVKGLFRALVISDEAFRDDILQEEHTQQLLNWYLREYNVFHPWDLNRFLGEVSGFGYFFSEKRLLDVAKGGLEVLSFTMPPIAQQAIKILTGFLDIEEPVAISKNDVPVVELLEELVSLCLLLGFKSIYVLVDDVDEPQYYGDRHDYQPAFDMIHSLASASKLIGAPGLIFKFFLPFEIREMCMDSLRLDKFSEQVITWTYEDLASLYRCRLEASRSEPPFELKELCDQTLEHIDEWLVDFAKEMRSPRALLYAGNELFTEHFRRERAIKDKITRATWERARQRAEEVLR